MIRGGGQHTGLRRREERWHVLFSAKPLKVILREEGVLEDLLGCGKEVREGERR